MSNMSSVRTSASTAPQVLINPAHNALYIDGHFQPPTRGGTFEVINPATEQVIAHAPAGTEEDIDLAVASARKCFDSDVWSGTKGTVRGGYLRAFAERIIEPDQKESLAQLETLNNGKPLAESRADIDDVAACFAYYAELAEKLDETSSQKVEIPDPRFQTEVVREPLGVVGAIIPWNYPLLMAAWKIAPALAAGCCVVLKPS